MTIKELYDWAVENNVADFNIKIQDCVNGVYFDGSSPLEVADIGVDKLGLTVTL